MLADLFSSLLSCSSLLFFVAFFLVFFQVAARVVEQREFSSSFSAHVNLGT